MITGKPGEYYCDEHVGGFFDEDGVLVVCEEFGLTDADTDKYSVEVQNGLGYYDDDGWYHSYGYRDDY